jgi:DNA-binding winged helix-turn-helix (wHTH) protein
VDLAREADFSIGPLWVRPSVCEVALETLTFSLQPRVLQVLVVLAQASGRVVSREELLARCWPGVVVGDDAVGRCIGRLRRLSEVEAPGAFTILTQARVGYRLVTAQPASQAEPEPEPIAETLPDALESAPAPTLKRRTGALFRLIAGLAAALLLCAATGLWIATHPPRSAYRVAVRDFKTQGIDAALGETLADRVAAAVNERQLPIVARLRSRAETLAGRDTSSVAMYAASGSPSASISNSTTPAPGSRSGTRLSSGLWRNPRRCKIRSPPKSPI